MSAKLVGQVFDLDAGLSPNETLVLLCLADATNHKTQRCDPGLERIAQRTNLSKRTVQNIIGRLVDGHHLERTSRPGKTTTYVVGVVPPDPGKAVATPDPGKAVAGVPVTDPGKAVATHPGKTIATHPGNSFATEPGLTGKNRANGRANVAPLDPEKTFAPLDPKKHYPVIYNGKCRRVDSDSGLRCDQPAGADVHYPATSETEPLRRGPRLRPPDPVGLRRFR